MYRGIGIAGIEETARMPGVRNALHARASARRDHGVERRRVRGILSVSALNSKRENIERPTSNIQPPIGNRSPNGCSALDVGCWMLAPRLCSLLISERPARFRFSNIR